MINNFLDIKIPKAAELPESKPPHTVSTKTTYGDQFLTVAIFVKLYVPYATTPKIIPVQKHEKLILFLMQAE